jgi:hypothetical protein
MVDQGVVLIGPAVPALVGLAQVPSDCGRRLASRR